jgi:rhamnulokinase
VNYFLSIDIGASSGRHIVGYYDSDNVLKIEEIYRFKTVLIDDGDNHCHWDVAKLYGDILAGLVEAKRRGRVPSRIGIDTFGVDYALLDENDQLLGNIASYRDERTKAAKKELSSPEKLFLATGVQPQQFNTVYQLYCDKMSGKLAKAKCLMMLPSYLTYLLTGVKQNELSIMSTSGILDCRNERYSPDVLASLGISESLFAPLCHAGDRIGSFQKSVENVLGYQSEVYATLEHDTASAFFGSGAHEDQVLLSSGTWSLIGAVQHAPCVDSSVFENGFTNELSFPKQVRFLKNAMGMWIINTLMEQSIAKRTIQEVVALARNGSDYLPVFDATDETLLNPKNMESSIYNLLSKQKVTMPINDAQLYFCVYHSLAKVYREAILSLKEMTKNDYRSIIVFGGGSKNELLNELTSMETKLPVFRGPSEATAIGNIKAISIR